MLAVCDDNFFSLCEFKLKIPFWKAALKYPLPLFSLAWTNTRSSPPSTITLNVKYKNEHDSAVIAVASHVCSGGKPVPVT